MANCAKVMFSSFLYLPPNQVNGVTASTPGIRSMMESCRAGKRFAMEILLRTATRNSAPAPSTGSVSSRNATSNVTSRNKLTATLKIESVARRLLRRAFLRMKPATDISGGER
jgi:hypothetical protein